MSAPLDGSTLPEDIYGVILSHLSCSDRFMRFTLVCKAFRMYSLSLPLDLLTMAYNEYGKSYIAFGKSLCPEEGQNELGEKGKEKEKVLSRLESFGSLWALEPSKVFGLRVRILSDASFEVFCERFRNLKVLHIINLKMFFQNAAQPNSIDLRNIESLHIHSLVANAPFSFSLPKVKNLRILLERPESVRYGSLTSECLFDLTIVDDLNPHVENLVVNFPLESFDFPSLRKLVIPTLGSSYAASQVLGRIVPWLGKLRAPRLESLDINVYSKIPIALPDDCRSSLTSLSLSEVNVALEWVKTLSLKELTLSGVRLSSFIGLVPTLESLQLNIHYPSSGDSLTCLPFFSHITDLRVVCSSYSSGALETVLDKLPNLTGLDLWLPDDAIGEPGPRSMYESYLKKVHARGLKTLKLDADISSFDLDLPLLTYLKCSLDFHPCALSELMVKLAECAPQLESLKVTECWVDGESSELNEEEFEDIITAVTKLARLRSFVIKRYSVSPDMQDRLRRAFPLLSLEVK